MNDTNMENRRRMQSNRRNERQTGYRRKMLFGKTLSFLIPVMLFLILLYSVKNVRTDLAELQTVLERIEVLQYGKLETGTKVEEGKETDYVSSIGILSVEKPVQRTLAETIQKLEELGETNPVIEEICRNTSLYPESILMALANNPEMADFVAGYVNSDKTVTGGFTEQEKEQDFPLLLQWDTRWGYHAYGDSCIGVVGCGPTCLAMVMLYLSENEVFTPDVIADYAMEKGYYVDGTGTAWALIDSFPIRYGIGVSETNATERAMKTELDKGNVLICAMGEGDFTVAGHFIVIYGYDEDGFKVNDPNCVARSRKRWTFDEIEEQIKKIWSYGK